MHVQIVNFHLQDMTEGEFSAMCDELAPAFAEAPGLLSKIWLANRAQNTYGGIYLWANRATFDAFTKSDLFNAVATNVHFAGITSRDYTIFEAPTRLTRGMTTVTA